MVRPEVLQRRLRKLDECLGIPHRLQRYRFIEATLDMGNHIIADLNLGEVRWYSDIPAILADRGGPEPDLKEKWIRMIGFRNIPVHEYVDLDRRIVYEVLQSGLEDLERLRRFFASFL
ncbi:DUF86 domain-containing protein [Thermoflexus sp.]|uniref:type VII toxin-antitoxin system HepT family RNase toxin n=1 Tax=Thermoflexus sp. TaxID=1969742 RepID=UPI0035E455D0